VPKNIEIPSDAEKVYLKPDIKLEPLVCGWYAWSHLLSPAQCGMNLIYRYVPLLQSFVRNPDIHVAASLDRALFGGPFVDLSKDNLGFVQQLLRDIESRCSAIISFARDLKRFDNELQSSATGYSLSSQYSRLPASLLGLVEFFYDINNHAKLRIHEELVYEEFRTVGIQQVLMSNVPDRDRKFFMSTPRLETSESALLNLHFSDPRLDLLASMRTEPNSLELLCTQLDIPINKHHSFARFFTTTPPLRGNYDYVGDGVRVRYFGHACVLVQTANTSILIDPIVAWDGDDSDQRYTHLELPNRIDFVVLTHNHQDHFSPEVLIQLRHRIGRVVVPRNNSGSITDPSMRLALNRLGFSSVDELSAFETIQFKDGTITSLPFPGEHVDLDIYSRHGIFLSVCGVRLAFLADSDGWDPHLFRRIARKTGKKLDALFVGMECHGAPLTWIYGPLLSKPISRQNDDSRRLSGLDSERAWKVIQEFDVSMVFIYAMGQEPWLRSIMGLEYTPESIQLKEAASLLDRCMHHHIPAEQLFISRELQFPSGPPRENGP
jgi:L-ascorbate metabolism protein UlaG (beta-lactamase superfamily)